jgi:ubiquinol-cytochrome c reductase cytochrome b subunit
MPAVLSWVDHRTGLITSLRRFLDEEIPASSGWHQVLGSVALFLFLIQAFTGAMLALNYAPAAGEAYYSVKYIMAEVTGGALMRGLHHWGASMMVVIVVLHMVQVLIWGGYKPPREATWMAGVLLLLLTMAYALTGYLLPWDNRAYWGTVVTTQIAGSAPGLGPYVVRLMGAENGVGAVTFARFYAAHVLLLPPATALLIALHVLLVRRHGVAPAPGDEMKPKKRFFPEQLFKDTFAVFVVFAVLFTLVVMMKAPLGRLADPTDKTFLPRPEWYFLFLFQMLKYFEGPLEILASVVLPALAIGALLALPFLDRKPAVTVRQRKGAMAAVLLCAVGWTALTAAALQSTPSEARQSDASIPSDWAELAPAELAGAALFQREQCAQCHALGVKAEKKLGPSLGAGDMRRDPAWMVAHFKSPGQLRPGSQMPPVNLSERELNMLAAFLVKVTPENAEKLTGAPQSALDGALLYEMRRCGMCHKVNGVGGKAGPPLAGLASRRTAAWVKGHFLEPKKFTPGSTMPAYQFSEKENAAITEYVMGLR